MRTLKKKFILRLYQHDNGYIDGRLQIEIHTDKRTQVHSARSSLTNEPRMGKNACQQAK